ncbi:MAG: PilZ domain-containing protein [Muribaculum sp.]|nr:PilZ domain-containing protein [Muribaculum sp.]
MEERRRNKRTAMESKLLMKRLDGGEHTEVAIDIVDVSKRGIGFTADCLLEVGQVYESYLTIWTKEVLHAFLRIVRIELKETEYVYGATFIGMPETEANRIEVYQSFHEGE